jgi:hypothetical protein
MALHFPSQNLLLLLVAMLEELLNHVVAKDVGHQLQGIWKNFAKQLLLLVAIGRFQLLLNEPRAMLVAAKLNHVVVDILSPISRRDPDPKRRIP